MNVAVIFEDNRRRERKGDRCHRSRDGEQVSDGTLPQVQGRDNDENDQNPYRSELDPSRDGGAPPSGYAMVRQDTHADGGSQAYLG